MAKKKTKKVAKKTPAKDKNAKATHPTARANHLGRGPRSFGF